MVVVVATGVVTMTAKELKNRTGEALRAVESGRRVVVTRRGRTVGVIVPAGSTVPAVGPATYDEAWAEIEAALSKSKPRYRTWQQAMVRSRRRT